MTVREKPLLLLVDDTPQNLQVLAATLELSGYDIALASGGTQAIAFAIAERPVLILLDVMMPGMDGYETCTRLKADLRTRDIPIIFLTARTQEEDIVAGFEAGGVDYIAKPFCKSELLARVKTHVELKMARDEIRTLRGFLPVCSSCKSIRSEAGEWQSMEEYLTLHTDVSLSHGLCPHCVQTLYPEIWGKIKDTIS